MLIQNCSFSFSETDIVDLGAVLFFFNCDIRGSTNPGQTVIVKMGQWFQCQELNILQNSITQSHFLELTSTNNLFSLR